MCGGGGGSGGGDSGNMGIDDSVADQSAVSGDTSSVGDDPSGPGDDGVSSSTSTSTSSSTTDTNTDQDSFNSMDNFSMPSGQNFSARNQDFGLGSPDGMDFGLNTAQQTEAFNNMSAAAQGPDAGLSYSALANIGNAANQAQTGDYTGFGRNIDGKDVSDFTTADQLNTMSNSINNPLSNLLTNIGLPTTQNRINQGYTPSYTGPKDNQQITGTMDYGIGMGMPTNDLNMTGRGLAVSNYSPFDLTQPQVDFGDIGNAGGDGSDSPQIIRRNPSDPVQDDPTDPILSDELASDYLQNPFYLYSGIGNQYQPYGYAQNTLVDLLRTRNMTQPQQRAANLGLFGNPGDFS